MTSISIVGTGYVGLAYAVAFASLGHDVVGVDIDVDRVDALNSGRSPIFEPGLEPLLVEGLAAERLRFTTRYDEGLAQANVIFICVSTPSMSGGDADLRSVRSAAVDIGARLPLGRRVVIVNKSTMPIGSADLVVQLVGQSAPVGAVFGVVSNPEFLREGAAIADVFRPDRIVLGSNEQWALDTLTALYEPMGAPILVTDRRSAELIKYAANAFLATKISFINEVAQISERLGADITAVARGIGLDRRIGPLHLQAGLGFGGSCFPKDVMALARIAARSDLHPQLLHAVMEINADQRRRFVDRTERLLGGSLEGRVIAMWGLAFKEDTDDIRDSPAIDVATMLVERGAAVRAYDPKAMRAAARVLPAVEMRPDPYAAADRSDAVLVVTPWAEFRNIDLRGLAKAMRGDLLMDGRNLFDPAEVMRAGLRYAGIGRGVFADRSEPVAAGSAGRDGAPAAS